MMAKGPARPRFGRTPPFSGQLVKVTGDGEHVTIAFTAATAEELAEHLTAAGAAALARVQANNAALLDAAATFEDRQRHVYAAAVGQLRRELGMPEPPAEEDATRADHPAGAVHATENP
jgi:hypothetical protein